MKWNLKRNLFYRRSALTFILIILSQPSVADQIGSKPNSDEYIAFSYGNVSQQIDSIQTEHESIWDMIKQYILPEPLTHLYKLRSYISSERFVRTTRTKSPAQKVDFIYNSALEITEGDIIESLLICSVATLPYRMFDAVIPIFGLVITIPVSTESREAFEHRIAHLPVEIFLDSKKGGDRDKLPHFFGSAYLVCISNSASTSEAIGCLVEWGESVFKLEGFSDQRDIEANRSGIAFGNALRRHEDVPPSQFMNVHLQHQPE